MISPVLVEVGRHINIEIVANTDVVAVEGEPGNFQVKLRSYPRFIDPAKCTGCGQCSQVCPVRGKDEFNQGLSQKAAIYIKYAQSVPLSYAIDPELCIGCGLCEKVCLAEAIFYADEGRTSTVDAGAVILAPGTTAFDPSGLDYYGYDRSPNVVTSLEFERILSASGPFQGHVQRPLDLRNPQKIAWLQCVGSRDVNRCGHAYCSSVCCMYAIKQTVIAKEHAGEDLECAIFYMDMRTHGKEFERYYDAAREKHGVRFVKSRVHTIDTDPESGDVVLRYAAEDGAIQEETFDMVVLSVGLEVSPEVVALAERLGVELTPSRFARTEAFAPVNTSRPGIFVCGAFQGPKDIPQSVVDASAAAAAAGELLGGARFTDTVQKEDVPQIDVSGQRPRIGVFVCKCGSNIAGVVDVPAVRDYAKTLPYVEYVEDNLYTCSQDTQERMAAVIREKGLNRVVVASCTPKTHEGVFQETLVNAGLNKYLFTMANIRNQDSWVHRHNPDLATEKAKDLVRMAVANVGLSHPLDEAQIEVNQTALVIGGGIAGMTAARSLADQGYDTHLVEKAEALGGQARHLFKTADDRPVQPVLNAMIEAVETHPRITVHRGAEVVAAEGFVGNFTSTIRENGEETALAHGVVIMATGGRPATTDEYGYGTDPRIVTSLDLDRRFIEGDPALDSMNTAVFIQCVGSREPGRPYCSRVCCTHSILSALDLKRHNPEMNVYILYRDIRTYGERELLYQEARRAGVIFIQYDLDHKPDVRTADAGIGVTVRDHVLDRPVTITTDLLVLATAIEPNDNSALANFYKLSLTDDGLFEEKHAKLGPSDFASDGVYLCGMAHYPKPVDEAVAQGKAAASRAVRVLAAKVAYAAGTIAQVQPQLCSMCGVCVSICPYSAPSFRAETERFWPGRAEINPVLCKGCGLCVASCRSGAIRLQGFDNDQIFAQLFALNEAS